MGSVTADITMTLNGYVQGLAQGTEVDPDGDQLRCSSDSLWKWAFEHADVHGGELRTAVSAGAFLMSAESEKHFEDGAWEQVVERFAGSVVPRVPVFVVGPAGLTSTLAEARSAAGSAPVSVVGDTAVTEQLIAAGLLDELRIHLPGVFRSGGTRLDLPDDAPITRRASPARGNEFVTHLTYSLS